MKSPKSLVLFGSSDLCRQVIRMLESREDLEILGIIDPHKKEGECILGHSILGDESLVKKYASETHGIIAIGDPFIREKVLEKTREYAPDFQWFTLIHPSVILESHVKIGAGSLLFPGVILQNDVSIGHHTLIGTGSILEHDTQIGDFCNISPGCIAGGNFTMGQRSVLGLGARVNQNITIGSDTIIGSGSLVLKDVKDKVLALGSPLTVQRSRQPGEPWL